MEDVIVILVLIKQILIIAILFIIGIFCYKKKIITEDANKSLSSLVVNIVNPAIIINSYQIAFSAERLQKLIYVLLLSFLSYAIIIPIANLLNRKGDSRNIDRIASIYSNSGFFGIPIVNSIYGAEGVFYITGFITVFNLMFWSHGVTVIEKKFDVKNLKKVIFSPSIIAILIGISLFLLKIDIMDPFGATIDAIAAMTTPLVMIISGVTIAQTNFLDTIKKPSIYKVTFQRLILLPLIVYAIFLFIPLPDLIKNIVVFGCACPVSTMGTIVCIRNGENSVLMSQYFAATTILSLFSLTLIQFILTAHLFS